MRPALGAVPIIDLGEMGSFKLHLSVANYLSNGIWLLVGIPHRRNAKVSMAKKKKHKFIHTKRNLANPQLYTNLLYVSITSGPTSEFKTSQKVGFTNYRSESRLETTKYNEK